MRNLSIGNAELLFVTAGSRFGTKRWFMRFGIRLCLVIVLLGITSATQAAAPLPRSAPEAEGASSAALAEFVTALDQQIDGMHSVMVVRHGAVIAEGWGSADDTCVLKLCAYETPFHTTLTLTFNGDQITLDSEVNVAFGPTKRPQLIGRAE